MHHLLIKLYPLFIIITHMVYGHCYTNFRVFDCHLNAKSNCVVYVMEQVILVELNQSNNPVNFFKNQLKSHVRLYMHK